MCPEINKEGMTNLIDTHGGYSMGGIDSGNTAWILISAALVFIMVPGLGFFYGGLVRSKNVVGTIGQSFMALAIIAVVWILWGYSLAFGPDVGGVIGNLSHFGLSGVSASTPFAGTDISQMAFMIFQAKFAIITPALVAGAFAERMRFSSFIVFIIAWSTFVYSPLAHWVWGGGWLGDWGALDFAGGAVVHISSGMAAVVAAIVMGNRRGLGESNLGPHNVPYVVLGASLLWFGWFGFNAGSALSAGAQAVNAFVVTHASASVACITWVCIDRIRTGKVSVVGAATGAVAGLATITPAAGFVGPVPALFIGLAAGAVCYMAVELKNKLKLDDSLDVWAIHGVGGTIGMLFAGIFMGIGFESFGDLTDVATRGGQIWRQIGAIFVTTAYAFVMTLLILVAMKYTVGLRLTADEEEEGLDLSQHGEVGYS